MNNIKKMREIFNHSLSSVLSYLRRVIPYHTEPSNPSRPSTHTPDLFILTVEHRLYWILQSSQIKASYYLTQLCYYSWITHEVYHENSEL